MFDLPEDLSGLTAAEVQAKLDEASAAFRALALNDESSDDDIALGEELTNAIVALRAEQTARDAAVTAKRERLARMAEIIATDETPTDPEVPEAPEPEAPEAPEPPADEPPITPDEVIEPREPALVASRHPVRRAAAHAPSPKLPRPDRVKLLAAADVPGYANGQALDDLDSVCAALMSRMRGLPRQNLSRKGEAVRHRYGAALIQKTGFGDLVQDKGLSDYALVAAAADERRLPGNSLVAAGGWCAPSETLYDLCQLETVEGILSIPEMQISRGGIRWTPGPSFDDIYDACGFFQTETQAIAGECKDCCIVECPAFDEIRMDLIGLCVKSPLLTETGYPELTRRFLEGALVAHQHKINKYLIDTIVAASGTPVVATDVGSLSLTLSVIELTAVGMRYRYRLSQSSSIEVVAPFWLRTLLRMDMGMRGDGQDVSDAQVDAWFSQRNLSVQWVYDWQDLTFDAANMCEVVLPANATVLMYPAGTWVKGTTDVINVDAVYDSAGLESNTYTALFTEEGILAVQRCTHTCAVTVPICVSGRTAAQDIAECLVAPAAV